MHFKWIPLLFVIVNLVFGENVTEPDEKPDPAEVEVVSDRRFYLTDLTKYPSYVYLDHDTNLRCEGAILNERWILTTRSCFKERTGSDDWSQEKYGFNVTAGNPLGIPKGTSKFEQKRQVIQYIEHPDLALAKLNIPLTFNEAVQPVKLAAKDKKPRNDNGAIVGWGQHWSVHKPDDEGGKYHYRFQQVPVMVRNAGECRGYGAKSKKVQADAALLCTEFLTTGAFGTPCDYFQGGPLYISEDGDFPSKSKKKGFILIGASVEKRNGCMNPREPGNKTGIFAVYASIPHYRDWIDEKLKELGYGAAARGFANVQILVMGVAATGMVLRFWK